MPSVYGLIIKDGVNYSHDTAASISYSNTTSGLTATTVQAAIDELVGAAGSGGHTIINDAGTSLAQKDNLQFKGVYTQNNGDNTEVDICRTMTKAQMEALSGESLKGFINTSDEPDSLPLTAEWVAYETGVSVKEVLDNKVSKSGDIMSGALNIKPSNTLGVISLGKGSNSSEYGVVQMYDDVSHWLNIMPSSQTDNRSIYFPNKNGTVALTSDLQWVLAYQDLTFDSDLVDVSAYSELYVVPKMQGYARSYPTFMLRLPSFDIATAGVEFSGSAITNGIMYGINIDSSNRLKLRGTLKGWTTVTFDIYGR